jgi:hypothetical protein
MRTVVRCVLILLGITASAHGKNCSWSQQFELKKPQVVAGVLKDPYGSVLGGIGIQLWSGHRMVRELRTNSEGAYDLGIVAAGSHRIHIEYGEKDPFCAPKIKCSSEKCDFDSELKLNPKNFVTVQ